MVIALLTVLAGLLVGAVVLLWLWVHDLRTTDVPDLKKRCGGLRQDTNQNTHTIGLVDEKSVKQYEVLAVEIGGVFAKYSELAVATERSETELRERLERLEIAVDRFVVGVNRLRIAVSEPAQFLASETDVDQETTDV